MFSTDGIHTMNAELEKMSEMFSRFDEKASTLSKPLFKNLGVTEEQLQKALEEIEAGEPYEPLLHQRKLRKREKLVRAWEYTLESGNSPLIFEMQDGCLWQFCDVGLGWTNFNVVGADWKLNSVIQTNLPAIINPHPANSQPWNYEFNLANGAILWVKPGSREKTFQWGVRTKLK